MNEKSLTVTEGQSPASIMQIALDKNVDIEKIGKMLEIQEKWEAMEAKKAYTQAMADFKSNPPTIFKDKKVGYENRDGSATGYNHASLGNVTTTINTGLAAHGLSAAWRTEQGEDGITVFCTITHKRGHCESTSLTAQADSSGKKNAIQSIGSTITYLERYTLLALTGLATHDQDDDGKAATPEIKFIDDKQKGVIRDLLADIDAKEDVFLEWLGCESIDAIDEKSYKRAVVNLRARKEEESK